MKEKLMNKLDKIHTTELGIIRIKKNLNINTDVVEFCKNILINNKSKVEKIGKNYYVYLDNYKVVINSYTYTIITAHIV